MADLYASYQAGLDSPYGFAAAVTPHDSTDFTYTSRAIYVGVSGDITAIVNGVAILFKAVPVGLLRIRCTRINATATTATNMVVLW